MLVLTRGQISEKKLPKSRFTSILTVFQSCAEIGREVWHCRTWSVEMQDMRIPAEQFELLPDTSDAADQQIKGTANFVSDLPRYRRKIQERCKLVASLQKSAMGKVHMHGIKMDGSVTIRQGCSTACHVEICICICCSGKHEI